jgi:hypothetical protein
MLYPVFKTELYDATVSGLRISSVDGTAFLDNCAALVPYANGRNQVIIYDASGRQLVGYLSAQGAGETLASTGGPLDDGEIYNDPGFDDATKWAAQTNWVVNAAASSKAVSSGGNAGQSAYQQITIQKYYLYKAVCVCSDYTSGTLRFRAGGSINPETNITGTGTTTYRFTSVDSPANSSLQSGTAGSEFIGAASSVSLKRITAPSTDGVLIVSTKGGATRNFASANASFTYNAAGYRCVVLGSRRITGQGTYI